MGKVSCPFRRMIERRETRSSSIQRRHFDESPQPVRPPSFTTSSTAAISLTIEYTSDVRPQSALTLSGDGYNYDSTTIRRPFDCLSKFVKVTVLLPLCLNFIPVLIYFQWINCTCYRYFYRYLNACTIVIWFRQYILTILY